MPGSFVDPEIVDRHTDLLFRVPLRGAGDDERDDAEPSVDAPNHRPGGHVGRTAYVYLLFEHQSAPDPLMAFRMLGYVVDIWRRVLRESPGGRLPIVLPLVLHHGPSGWTPARHLHGLVSGLDRLPELARFVPSFEILVDDLAALDDATLLRRPLAPLPLVALWLLRDGRDPRALLAHLAAFARALQALADGPRDDVATVLRYLVVVTGDLPFETVRRELAKASTKLEEKMVSHVDQAYENGKREGLERGLERGLEQGRTEALRVTLVRQLDARFGPLPEGPTRRIASASLDELDRWVERVITAASLDAVFDAG